jgi:hypothetical protein
VAPSKRLARAPSPPRPNPVHRRRRADARLGPPSQLRRRACLLAVACRRPTCGRCW